MSNTLTNTQNQIIADAAVREFNTLINPLRAFSTDYSPAPTEKGKKVTVPVFPSHTAAAFAGDYSGPDGAVTGVDVTLDQHYFVSRHITDKEAAESSVNYLDNFGRQNGAAVARSVLANLFALVTAANFGNAAGDKLVVAAASFSADTIADIRAKVTAKGIDPSACALVLNSAYFTALLKDAVIIANPAFGGEAIRSGMIKNLFGFAEVHEAPTLPANGENLGGFACAPQAVGVAMRYLMPQSTKSLEDYGSVSDEVTGATLGFRVIGEPLAGKTHIVSEALWGSAKVDGKALVRVLTA